MDNQPFKQNLAQLLQKSNAHADLDAALNSLDKNKLKQKKAMLKTALLF